MNNCPFQVYLSPYHDQELDAEMCRQIQRHLSTCPACTAELQVLRELSARISAVGRGAIEPAELARMHDVVERAAAEELSSSQLLRTAGFFGALAASLLIVGGAWLRELPPVAGKAAASGSSAVALAPDWESVAINLRADPRPGLADDSPFSPRYAAAVDWMLDSLAITEQKPWAKPSSL